MNTLGLGVSYGSFFALVRGINVLKLYQFDFVIMFSLVGDNRSNIVHFWIIGTTVFHRPFQD